MAILQFPSYCFRAEVRSYLVCFVQLVGHPVGCVIVM
jgi:hypothetical protein